jgi:hypothetical protein
MNSKIKFRRLAIVLAVFAAAFCLSTVNAVAAGPGSVTTTVTAVGKKKDTAPPEVKKDDIQLYKGKERLQVADWRRSEKLFLAILIDDSLESETASQWSDLKAFINAQPPSTYISVAYGRNGEAALAQDFTTDHTLAAKAIRIPIGSGGAFSSPYLELQDLIKRLPASGERRSIMFFTSGIDYFRGNFGPQDPDLDTTIEHAQKANINIWTIYAPDAGHLGRGFFRVSLAQSNLSQLSDESGGESYYLGFGTPVTFKPYFDDIDLHLKNQYLLTFEGSGGKKGRFERVRVTTELGNLEFLTPSEVFVPASPQ